MFMSKSCQFCQLLVVWFLIIFGDRVQSSTVDEKLLRNLFTHYDRTVRPAQPHHSIDVMIAFKINQIEFDEAKGLFTVSAHLIAEWIDPKLKWERTEYANISKVHLTRREVWLPDLSFYNSVGSKTIDISDSSAMCLENNGLVTWSMKVRLQTLCELNTFRWPYDRHGCAIKLGCWTYDGLQVDLLQSDKIPLVNQFIENPEFKITNVTKKRMTTLYDCCPEPYVTLEYSIEFERRSSAFASVFIMPAFCVVIMTLCVFCLPPHRGEKILLNGITLFVIVIYITYFIENLPSFALSIPLIVIFHCVSFVLVTISMIISVLVLGSARSRSKGRLPPGLAKILRSRIGEFLGPTNDSKKPDPTETELSHHFEDGKSHETHSLIRITNCYDEWTSLGIVLDRMFFVLYSGIFILMGIVCYL